MSRRAARKKAPVHLPPSQRLLLERLLQVFEDGLDLRLVAGRALDLSSAHDALLVDNEVGPLGEARLMLDAVLLYDLALKVRGQRKRDAPLLGPRPGRPRGLAAAAPHPDAA